jgi:hypothetical protein
MGIVWVELVENAVFQYPAEGLKSWRFCRLLYWNGKDSHPIHKGGIWLPQMFNSGDLEDCINKAALEDCLIKAALLKLKGRQGGQSADE